MTSRRSKKKGKKQVHFHQFRDAMKSLLGGGNSGVAVTPSNTTTYSPVLRSLRVGTGGDVTVVFENDTDPVTIPDVLSGETLPIRVKKVMLTGTDASGIVGYR